MHCNVIVSCVLIMKIKSGKLKPFKLVFGLKNWVRLIIITHRRVELSASPYFITYSYVQLAADMCYAYR